MAEPSGPLLVMFAVFESRSEPHPDEQHVDLLAETVAKHRGHVVKRLNDGVMAVFTMPDDGVSGALKLQRSVSERARKIPALRVGLSFGEPFVEDGDYFGTPVVVARRLCDRANPGQVLCTSVIETFASRERAAFRTVGLLDLKGIATLIDASEVLELDNERAGSPTNGKE